jgi:hypothetical protein
MNTPNRIYKQRGATLIVGLIMLVLITLVVTTAFIISSTNLKSVANMQYREEALASANNAIEQVVSSTALFLAPVSTNIVVGDYAVTVTPTCLYTTDVILNSSSDPSSNIYTQGGVGGGSGVAGYKNTFWDLAATAVDTTLGFSGAAVTAHQGIKITLPASPNPCP